MNMAEYIQALENYVASRKLNLGDGESSDAPDGYTLR